MNAPEKNHLPALPEEWLVHAHSDLNPSLFIMAKAMSYDSTKICNSALQG